LQINPKVVSGIGIDLGINSIRLVLCDLSGEISFRQEYKIKGSVPVVNQLKAIIKEVTGKFRKIAIKCIGIGSNGFVNYLSGRSIYSTHMAGLDDIPLKDIIEKEFGIYTAVDDISRVFAFAESQPGARAPKTDFVYIFLDSGIGCGIFLDGKLLRGDIGVSGEIGHIKVSDNGIRCGCGNTGCLETYASTISIVRQVKEAIAQGVHCSLSGKSGISIDDIIKAAREGDKLALSVMTEAAEHVGKVCANVLNIFGIKSIVIGGKLKEAGELVLGPVRRIVKEQSLGLLANETEIKASSLNDDGGAVGAGLLALNSLFDSGEIYKIKSIRGEK